MKIKHIQPHLGHPDSAADHIRVTVIALHNNRLFWEGTAKQFREGTPLLPKVAMATPLEEWEVITITRIPDDTIPIYNRGYIITVG